MITRRNVLKTLGSAIAWSPVQMLAGTIVNGLLTRAASAATGTRPRNYLLINMYGGPARWVFDSPLRLNGNESLLPNPMIGTRFAAAPAPGPGTLEYASHDVAGFQMPHLWGFDVPRAGGGTRPMADLMGNMLVLRGFDMGLDGHSINNTRIVTPLPGGPCLNGLVADAAQASIPAINIGASPGASAYFAPQGTGAVDIPVAHEAYLDFLFAPFAGADADLLRDRAHVDATVTQALAALRTASVQASPGHAPLFRDRDNAEKLLRDSIEGFHAVYADLVGKYEDLITRSVRNTRLAGLTDRPVPGLKLPFVAAGDVTRDVAIGAYANEALYLGNDDLRTMFDQATLSDFAKQLALAEYVLTKGLSASVMINPGPLANLTFENSALKADLVKTMTAQGDSKFSLAPGAVPYSGTEITNILRQDPHFTGTYLTLLGHSLYFRAIAACLVELIDRLKAAKVDGLRVFDETVVHLASEFDRNPRVDGSGSDHGFRGNVASIFSGAVDRPLVLGNIYDALDLSTTVGTWGEGAPVRGLKNRVMELGHVMSSLAALLRVPSPTPNNRPVIAVKGNSTIPTIEKAELVPQTRP